MNIPTKTSTIHFNTIHKENLPVNFSFLPKKAVAGNLGCLQFVMWSKVVFFCKIKPFRLFLAYIGKQTDKERNRMMETYKKREG